MYRWVTDKNWSPGVNVVYNKLLSTLKVAVEVDQYPMWDLLEWLTCSPQFSLFIFWTFRSNHFRPSFMMTAGSQPQCVYCCRGQSAAWAFQIISDYLKLHIFMNYKRVMKIVEQVWSQFEVRFPSETAQGLMPMAYMCTI